MKSRNRDLLVIVAEYVAKTNELIESLLVSLDEIEDEPQPVVAPLPAAPTKQKDVLSMDDVTELTGFTRGYIYQLVHSEKIPCHKPTGKRGRLFFLRKEVLDFAARHKQTTGYEVSETADAILNGERK